MVPTSASHLARSQSYTRWVRLLHHYAEVVCQLATEQVPRGGAAGDRRGLGNPCFILPHHRLPLPTPRHLLIQLPVSTVFPDPKVSQPHFSQMQLLSEDPHHVLQNPSPCPSPVPNTFSSWDSSSHFSLFLLRLSPHPCPSSLDLSVSCPSPLPALSSPSLSELSSNYPSPLLFA